MKTVAFKTISLTLLGLGIFSKPSYSMDGALLKKGEGHFERTQLSLSDLRKLLKSPSHNSQAQELISNLDEADKTKLSAKLARLEKEKLAKISAEKKSNQKIKQDIKTERKKVQLKRIQSQGTEEETKNSLFTSLLDEANADAKLEQRINEIEQAYAISFTYYLDEQNHAQLQDIALNNNSIWNFSYQNLASKD